MRRIGAVLTALALVVASAAWAATFRGTAGNDRLVGTSKADRMDGYRGKDRLSGRGGGDTIRGGRGRDRLIGKRGHDLLLGGPRSDRLNGGPGDDDLIGATGADRLRDGPGLDVVDAGRGDDVVLSRNGSEDEIDCGDGVDTAVLDETEDGVFDCEELQLPPEPEPESGA